MPEKSRDAFRTISEVAEWLDTPAHVLRFWESKFSQVKPVKRAGGRRYYRPADMALIGGIKRLLHDEGMTIKGVQKLLREQGVRHVANLSPPVDGTADTVEAAAAQAGTVLPFDPGPGPDRDAPAAEIAQVDGTDPADAATQAAGIPTSEAAAPEDAQTDAAAEQPVDAPDPAQAASPLAADPAAPGILPDGPAQTDAPAAQGPGTDAAQPTAAPSAAPDTGVDDDTEPQTQPDLFEAPSPPMAPTGVMRPAGDLPSFLRSGAHASDAVPPEDSVHPPRPQPIRVNLPPDPDDDSLEAPPGPLAQMSRLRRLTPEAARAMQPHLDALHAIRARRAEAAHE